MADKTLDRRIAEVQVERQKACSVPLRTEVGPALAHTLCLAEPPEVKVMYLFAGKPRGFPWLSQHHKAVVEEANMFVDRCITACITCRAAGGKFIIENPEDLSLVKDERSGSGSGQKFWTSFLLATPTHLQFNNVTLVPSLPNQRGFLVRLNFRMRDVMWVCHVTSWEHTKGHCRSHVATLTKQTFGQDGKQMEYKSDPAGLCKFLADLFLNAKASYGRGRRTKPSKLLSPKQPSTGGGGSSSSCVSAFLQGGSGSGESFFKWGKFLQGECAA